MYEVNFYDRLWGQMYLCEISGVGCNNDDDGGDAAEQGEKGRGMSHALNFNHTQTLKGLKRIQKRMAVNP